MDDLNIFLLSFSLACLIMAWYIRTRIMPIFYSSFIKKREDKNDNL